LKQKQKLKNYTRNRKEKKESVFGLGLGGIAFIHRQMDFSFVVAVTKL